MEYLLLLLLIINPTIAYATFFKRKFEENIVLTIVSYITILFLAGVFEILHIGFYLIILLNILLLGYNIYSIIKKKVDLKEQVFTFGFILFILSYMFILWISAARLSIEWDEFSHWSLAVRNMFTFNNLGLGEESNLLCKDYLSGTSIFQFFCTKLAGKYKEGMLYIGMNLMLVATLIPMFKNIKNRKSLIAYICYGIMFFVPMYFYQTIYKTLYVDGLLALAFGYTLYSYFSDKDENLNKFKVINLMASLLWLSFIKNFGLVFAAGSVFIILVDNLFVRNKFKIKLLWKNSKYILLAAIPMILVQVIWMITLNYNNVTSSGTSTVLPTILNFIRGDILPYQETTIDNYMIALFEKPLTISYSMTYVTCVCISIILAYIANINANNKKSTQAMLTLSVIGSFAYAILLLFVPFLTMFSEYEAINLASYPRYMSSYVLGLIWMELAMVIIEISNKKEKLQRFTLIFLAIFIVTFPFTYIEQLTLLGRSQVQETINARERFNTFDRILTENVEKDEKVYFIATDTNGGDYYIAKYIATPIKLNHGWTWSWSISDAPYYEGDLWTMVVTPEQWKQELIYEYDYVYLHNIDNKFIENYGSLFYNIQVIKNNQLYKVNKEQGVEKILELVAE